MIRTRRDRAGRAAARSILVFCLLALPVCGGKQEEPGGAIRADCPMCGMDSSISKGRFILDFQDGTTLDCCSGHCAAMLAAKQASPLYRVRVYGYDVDELIDGRKAVFVLGAHRIPEKSMAPSVFAFSTREAAEALVREHNGRLGTLEAVLAMAEEDPHT